jgi:hypothetical protein
MTYVHDQALCVFSLVFYLLLLLRCVWVIDYELTQTA